MIYAYAICEAGSAAPPPRRRGLGGARLRTVERGRLAAVYSRHRTMRPEPSREAVLTHERVIEAIMARGAVLPLRFGTRLEDEKRLASVLDERGDELLRTLDAVRGQVEVGVRVLPVQPSASTGRSELSGRDYLLARLADHRRTEQLASELHVPLATLAAASRVHERPTPPGIFAASYLLDPAAIPDFRARAAELAERQDGMRVVVTGPWPPYSFVSEEPG